MPPYVGGTFLESSERIMYIASKIEVSMEVWGFNGDLFNKQLRKL